MAESSSSKNLTTAQARFLGGFEFVPCTMPVPDVCYDRRGVVVARFVQPLYFWLTTSSTTATEGLPTIELFEYHWFLSIFFFYTCCRSWHCSSGCTFVFLKVRFRVGYYYTNNGIGLLIRDILVMRSLRNTRCSPVAARQPLQSTIATEELPNTNDGIVGMPFMFYK